METYHEVEKYLRHLPDIVEQSLINNGEDAEYAT
jgi:hypothetical protein